MPALKPIPQNPLNSAATYSPLIPNPHTSKIPTSSAQTEIRGFTKTIINLADDQIFVVQTESHFPNEGMRMTAGDVSEARGLGWGLKRWRRRALKITLG